MQGHDMVVIGSSAGGVAALRELLQLFPKDTPATFFIVQHLSPDTKSVLASILARVTDMPVIVPKDLEPIQNGRIYLAPADHHMIIEGNRILIRRGPKENRFRPSIDVTMRSLAYAHDGRVTGIVLTGRLSDGSSGLWTIKEMGGTVIVQDPADAIFPDMPGNALKAVQADHVLPLKEIGPLILSHVGRAVSSGTGNGQPVRQRIEAEIGIAAEEHAFEKGVINMGEKTNLTCPECGGALTGIREGPTLRYRCHTGHAFSADALWSGITEGAETHLWQALRSMEEAIILLEQTATESHRSGNQSDSDRFHKQAEQLRLRSRRLLDLIYEHKAGDEFDS